MPTPRCILSIHENDARTIEMYDIYNRAILAEENEKQNRTEFGGCKYSEESLQNNNYVSEEVILVLLGRWCDNISRDLLGLVGPATFHRMFTGDDECNVHRLEI